MQLHHILLIFHLLAATIWIGGHLLLVVSYIPKALRENDRITILNFENMYERLGMTSLFVLIVTGFAMALSYGVYPVKWFHFADPLERIVSLKLLLLMITIGFAVSAKFRVIPKLKSGKGTMTLMIIHIIAVTTIGVLMLVMGSSIRFGGL